MHCCYIPLQLWLCSFISNENVMFFVFDLQLVCLQPSAEPQSHAQIPALWCFPHAPDTTSRNFNWTGSKRVENKYNKSFISQQIFGTAFNWINSTHWTSKDECIQDINNAIKALMSDNFNNIWNIHNTSSLIMSHFSSAQIGSKNMYL